jgi:Phage integrase, N-terminal SAM-like domain
VSFRIPVDIRTACLPKDMGGAELETFLTHLAVQEQVAASTQNQALSAILFLDRDALKQDLEKGDGLVYLPFALERKYPNADREWVWQFVFPSDRG